MKRAWLALGLLAAVIGLSLWHGAALRSLTGEVEALLVRAGEAAEAWDWDRAEALTRRAEERWREGAFFLHVTLRHGPADQVEESFGEARAMLEHQDRGGYAAANARLLTRLALLRESELPTWENLL